MSILRTVQRDRAERQRRRREAAIGADLIPRAERDDPRYAGVDLAARGRDREALRIGVARLDLAPDDLPARLKATAERIAHELREAEPEEIGRFATDIRHAFGEVPHIAPAVETAMYHAWALSLVPRTCQRLRHCGRTGPCDDAVEQRACAPVSRMCPEDGAA